MLLSIFLVDQDVIYKNIVYVLYSLHDWLYVLLHCTRCSGGIVGGSSPPTQGLLQYREFFFFWGKPKDGGKNHPWFHTYFIYDGFSHDNFQISSRELQLCYSSGLTDCGFKNASTCVECILTFKGI